LSIEGGEGLSGSQPGAQPGGAAGAGAGAGGGGGGAGGDGGGGRAVKFLAWHGELADAVRAKEAAPRPARGS